MVRPLMRRMKRSVMFEQSNEFTFHGGSECLQREFLLKDATALPAHAFPQRGVKSQIHDVLRHFRRPLYRHKEIRLLHRPPPKGCHAIGC
jgi:hypothetical protein